MKDRGQVAMATNINNTVTMMTPTMTDQIHLCKTFHVNFFSAIIAIFRGGLRFLEIRFMCSS